jgi:plastocyanin
MRPVPAVPSRNVTGALLVVVALVATAARYAPFPDSAPVSAKLSEWKVELSEATIAAGPVTFTVSNAGSIPHAFEVEGQGIEEETKVIQPGTTATLTLTLKPGTYEVYCPVGDDSQKKPGMVTRLEAVGSKGANASGYGSSAMDEAHETKVQAIRVTSGGPVIQILPGPFPFPDSAAPILQAFGDEREGLESQVKNGPYSNTVAPAAGTFSFTAWDKGAIRDSVDGVAEVTTRDGAQW